jgi:hypothetical protein
VGTGVAPEALVPGDGEAITAGEGVDEVCAAGDADASVAAVFWDDLPQPPSRSAEMTTPRTMWRTDDLRLSSEPLSSSYL